MFVSFGVVLFEGVYGVVGGTDGKIEPLVGCLGWVVKFIKPNG